MQNARNKTSSTHSGTARWPRSLNTPQLHPFRTSYMSKYFHIILEVCREVACNDDDFDTIIAPALTYGLVACDGAQDTGMTTDDVYEAAYTLAIDEDNTAAFEAFAFGAVLALTQSIDQALEWAIVDEEDYQRAVDKHNSYGGTQVTVETVRDHIGPIEIFMLSLQSYIDDRRAEKQPTRNKE